MRFRYKLSLMFVALALVPLVVVAVVMSQLISQDQTSTVDGKVNAAVAAGLASYHARLQQIHQSVDSYARSPLVSKALSGRADPAMVARKGPLGVHIQLLRNGVPLPGSQPQPQGPAFKIRVNVGTPSRQVVAWVPIDQNLFDTVQQVGLPSPIQLALVANGRVVASSNGRPGGRASGLRIGHSVDATLAGNAVRAQSARVPWSQHGPVSMVATYPSSELSNAIDSRRLRLLVPLLIAGLLVAVIAFFAAGRISQALTDLSARARALLRAGSQPPPGDELSELGAVIDHMSTELSTRVDELEAERARVKETLHRYGETLAATHDLDALVNAVLDTAVQATRGRGGRLLLYDSETGQATEHARIGTAIGSRTDLPMTVSAGSGLEGLALSEMAPRAAASPRPVLAAPIVREDELLGLVTVVDPEGGAFGAGDVETLAGLAVQAGVAIENARLHRVVEQQAVTDALTGLANRRQFYEVLGREYERAQRFGHELGLILLDIDDFKQINDTLGHLAGDAVLHAIGQTVQSMIREIDVAARYGGEEFAILLPQTGREGAAQLAQRLRGAIAERDIVFAGTPVEGVTASFGVAAGPEDGVTQLDLIASADAALYEAKRGGKNDVVVG